MRAIGHVFYREEEVDPPLYIRRHVYKVLPEERRTVVNVPCIKVVLRPVPDFCEGMPYENMESDDKTVVERTISLQIYPVLIKFLEKEDQTVSETLQDMHKTMGLRNLKREIAAMDLQAASFKWVPPWQLNVNRYDDPLTRETHYALIEFMQEHGSFLPVIVGHYNVILEGEMRYLAWRASGHERIPVIQAPIEVKYAVPWWKRWWRQGWL